MRSREADRLWGAGNLELVAVDGKLPDHSLTGHRTMCNGSLSSRCAVQQCQKIFVCGFTGHTSEY